MGVIKQSSMSFGCGNVLLCMISYTFLKNRNLLRLMGEHVYNSMLQFEVTQGCHSFRGFNLSAVRFDLSNPSNWITANERILLSLLKVMPYFLAAQRNYFKILFVFILVHTIHSDVIDVSKCIFEFFSVYYDSLKTNVTQQN